MINLTNVKQLVKFTVLMTVIIGLGAAGIVNAQGNDKVTICHVPPGNPGNAHTITVSENALDAHLGHGDYEGPCEEVEEEDQVYVDVTGVIASYNPGARIIILEDGKTLILYRDLDFEPAVGAQILARGYEIDENRFVILWITTETELPDTEAEPRLPVWIDLTGEVTSYNETFGAFYLGTTPVILTFNPDFPIEDGMMLTVHGELLPDGRLLVEDITEYVEPDTEIEVPTDGPVTICHVPPGNSNNAHTITVDASSVSDHLGHGDYLGACGEGESAEVITDETVIVDTACEGPCNPELLVLTDAFGVPYTDLIELLGQGYNFVEIARFYIIADVVDVDVEQVIADYEGGIGWGQMLEQYPDFTPSDFRSNSNLGTGR